MDTKLLTESNWKATAQKFKVKDNGLQKALAIYEKLDEAKFDDRLKAVGAVSQLAGALKKDKTVAVMADVVKYLTSVAAAAESDRGEITKAKASAEKNAALAAKKEQDAAKKDQEKEGGGEEEEESGDALTKLTNALKTLRTAKQPYFFLVCDVKPYGLMLSKKEIKTNAQAKKELSQLAGGSTRPPKFGTCHFDSGKLVFDMDKPPSGLARILQKWIKDNTGLGLKVMVGTESAEDEESAANEPAGAAAKPPSPALAKAPELWQGTRKILDANINKLKEAIRNEFANASPAMIAGIEKTVSKLDVVLEKLDHRLADSLEKAHSTTDGAARQAALKNSQAILHEYLEYVNTEPLIAHIDTNPFGVQTNLKRVLADSLNHLNQAMS